MRSLRDGRVFDRPEATWRRYVEQATIAKYACWRFNHKIRSVPKSRDLRIEALAQFVLRWTSDAWQTTHDQPSHDTGLGVHLVDCSTDAALACSAIDFTFQWSAPQRWEGTNFRVLLGGREAV